LVRRVWLLSMVSLLLLLGGCGVLSGTAPTADVRAGTANHERVAVVNGEIVTLGQLNTRLNLFKLAQPGQATRFNSTSIKKEILQELVDEALLLQAARKAHVTAGTAQVQRDLASFEGQFVPGVYKDQQAFHQALSRLGLSIGTLKAYVVTSDTISAYLARYAKVPPVTSAQVDAWYKAHESELRGPNEYHLRHILVRTKAEAEKILADLHRGQSFSALAKKYSIDKASAVKGGDLGWAPLSQYVPAFADAAAKLTKVGQLSGIVHSPYGYHIIELLGIRPGSLPALATVAPQIRSYLQGQAQQQAVTTLLAKLRAKAKVQIYPVPKA
jgi:parvulin-like peptidyl-prolyl isomerase